jgi:hypothetical protein
MSTVKNTPSISKEEACNHLQQVVQEKQQEEQNARQIQEEITQLENKEERSR